MPELPEVQTIINTLLKSGMLHHPITKINIYKRKLLKNSTPNTFINFLQGESFENIERKGKFFIFSLTHNKTLVVHLRMEGKLFYEKNHSTVQKTHLRVEFFFKNDFVLRYYDSRIFGTFHIYKNQEHLRANQLTKLGLDPLAKDFKGSYLKNQLIKSNKAIKTCLLDQTKVSGIGNIYADEILFLSGINPTKKANLLHDKDFDNIAKYSKQVLQKSIKFGGTTIATYLSSANHTGRFQNMLLVHTKEGSPCIRCHTKIVKIKLNGRGTYYCPNCQK
ncbi:MAG: DNA-formamidopyrimidine glycosylase [Mycoplasmataceae bacterium]|jgi:formamidopyrimidine-DNA glycosylase|nr:DNA-formamidopyrimidine glycosylase [Mycoplasmataceae bacterium]